MLECFYGELSHGFAFVEVMCDYKGQNQTNGMHTNCFSSMMVRFDYNDYAQLLLEGAFVSIMMSRDENQIFDRGKC